jgi:hypothetical protein
MRVDRSLNHWNMQKVQPKALEEQPARAQARVAPQPARSTERIAPEPARVRMGDNGTLAAMAQQSSRQAARVLTPEQLDLVTEGLKKLQKEEGVLAEVVQRSLNTNKVLRQVTQSSEQPDFDPGLLQDVVAGELMQMAEDAQTTIDALKESGINNVLRAHRDKLTRWGAMLPEEDLRLLMLLETVDPERAIAFALARAAREQAEQERRSSEEVQAMLNETELAEPAPVKFERAPQYVRDQAARVEKSLAPDARWRPWKGLFKVLQGSVLGAGNLSLGIAVPMNPTLILGVVASVGASMGSFAEAIDDLSGCPKDVPREGVRRRYDMP